MTDRTITQNALRPVGVLGGMGPEATILFMRRVLDGVQADDDADHIPLLVDQNPQVPSRIKALIEGTGEDPTPVLAAMAQSLEAAGAEALVMPCNTAHAYAGAIAESVTIPFLSMVDLTARAIAEREPGAKVGMLVSPAVKRTAIFEGAFEAEGLTLVYAEDQDGLLAAIRLLKRNADDPEALQAVSRIALDLHQAGAAIVLVGCSEFSLLADRIGAQVPAIDSVDVLAGATIAFSRHEERSGGLPHMAARRPGAPISQNHSGHTTREAAE